MRNKKELSDLRLTKSLNFIKKLHKIKNRNMCKNKFIESIGLNIEPCGTKLLSSKTSIQ